MTITLFVKIGMLRTYAMHNFDLLKFKFDVSFFIWFVVKVTELDWLCLCFRAGYVTSQFCGSPWGETAIFAISKCLRFFLETEVMGVVKSWQLPDIKQLICAYICQNCKRLLWNLWNTKFRPISKLQLLGATELRSKPIRFLILSPDLLSEILSDLMQG